MQDNRGLWRGKRVVNSKWVEGFYLKHTSTTQTGERLENFIYEPYTDTEYNVIPETLGEYTGLTDKNGTRIFEGDIVRNSVGTVYVIKWDVESLAFVFSCFKCETGKEVPRPLVVTYEVIGNIYDNPELLEGDNNDCSAISTAD